MSYVSNEIIDNLTLNIKSISKESWHNLWSKIFNIYDKYYVDNINNKILLDFIFKCMILKKTNDDVLIEMVDVLMENNNKIMYLPLTKYPKLLNNIMRVIKGFSNKNNKILIPNLYDMISKNYYNHTYKLKDNILLGQLDLEKIIKSLNNKKIKLYNNKIVDVIIDNFDKIIKIDNKILIDNLWDVLANNNDDRVLDLIEENWQDIDKDYLFWNSLATNNNSRAINLIKKNWIYINRNDFFWDKLATNNNNLAVDLIIRNWHLITIDNNFWQSLAKNTNDKIMTIIYNDLEEEYIDCYDYHFWNELAKNAHIDAINLIYENHEFIIDNNFTDILYNLCNNENDRALLILSNILENVNESNYNNVFENLAKNNNNQAISILLKFWYKIPKTNYFWYNLAQNTNTRAVNLIKENYYIVIKLNDFWNYLALNKNEHAFELLKYNFNNIDIDEKFWFNLALNENDDAIELIKNNLIKNNVLLNNNILSNYRFWNTFINNNNEKAFNIVYDYSNDNKVIDIYNLRDLIKNPNIYEINYKSLQNKILDLKTIINSLNN
jgi:hypothetical protein